MSAGESLDAMFLFKILHYGVDVVGALLEDLLGSLEDDDFSLDFVQDLLHNLEVGVLYAQVSGILFK